MKSGEVFLITLVVIIFIMIIFIAVYVAKYEQPPGLIRVDGFGEPQPVDGDRSQCLIYNTFSQDVQIVDLLEPVGSYANLPTEGRCSDGFTRALQKQKRVCQSETCTGKNGQTYVAGETEFYYASCGNFPPCTQPKSLYVLPYVLNNRAKVDVQRSRCLSYENEFSFQICERNNTITSTQLFDIEQSGTLSAGEYPIYRIRYLDYCLLPLNDSNVVYAGLCNSDTQYKGYRWVLNNSVIVKEVDDEPIIYAPPQFSVYNVFLDYKGKEWVSQTISLQDANGVPYLDNMTLCEEGKVCLQGQTISVYAWQQLFD